MISSHSITMISQGDITMMVSKGWLSQETFQASEWLKSTQIISDLSRSDYSILYPILYIPN